jgi:protein TonB
VPEENVAHGQAASEVAPVAATPASLRCESCGGPAQENGLCDECERIFRNVLEAKPSPAVEPNAAFADAVALAARPARISLSAGASSAPPPLEPFTPPPPPPPVAQAAQRSAGSMPFMGELAKLYAALPQLAPRIPRTLDARTRSMAMAAVLLVVLSSFGVLLGQQWLDGEETESTEVETAPPIDRDEPPVEGVQEPPTVRIARAASHTGTDSAPPPSSPPRKSTPPPSRAASARTSRAKPGPREAVPVAAPLVATEAPALETLAPAAPPVAPETTMPAPVEAPVGPLFEMTQVNEPPRIASQVEPSVPDVLQGPLNDVVIVRVLVSQSGHAATVNLLRRSKAGAALDEAVIAAVKQWTFSPARKRGQAVSCWFNVGVPLRRGE